MPLPPDQDRSDRPVDAPGAEGGANAPKSEEAPGASSISLALLDALDSISPPAPPEAKAQPAAEAPPAPAPAPREAVRTFAVAEVRRMLAGFAAVMLLLDADGLLTWARRMEVGPAQSFWLAVVTPLQKGLDAAGLTRPRRALSDGAEALSRRLGGRADPLFAEAWGLVELAPYLDALAEGDEAAALGSVPGLLGPDPDAAPGAPTLLLVGDSLFAGNLAAAITGAFRRDGATRVVSAYQMATGLSRPDVFDWGRVVGPLMERERPRWVVCSFGANDAQAIRVNDALLKFGEPAWDAVYRARVRTMMRQVGAGGTRVLWLGLPPMRDAALDRRAKHLNQIFKREAKAVPGVEFLELDMLFTGPDGRYATFVSDGKALLRMRLEDGVHYAPAGARAIARWVSAWVRERPLGARGEAPATAP